METRTWTNARRKRRLQGGKCADAAWRHDRAVKAGTAASKVMKARFAERCAALETKQAAYTRGYQSGYARASNWWKAKYQRLYAEHLALWAARPLGTRGVLRSRPVSDARTIRRAG